MRIGGVALAKGQAHEHGIGVHNAHAANLHVGKAALGCGGRAHRHKAGSAVAGLRRGGRRGVCARHFSGASGQGAGTVAEGNKRIALETGRHGFALLHGHKARIHTEAVAKLVKAAINDKLRSGLTAQCARRGKVDGFAAAALQLARRVHGHNAHAALLELVSDDLRHVLGGIGHFRPGIYLKGQHQNQRALRCASLAGHKLDGAYQSGDAKNVGQDITQDFFHTESPLSVPGCGPCLRPVPDYASRPRESCPARG